MIKLFSRAGLARLCSCYNVAVAVNVRERDLRLSPWGYPKHSERSPKRPAQEEKLVAHTKRKHPLVAEIKHNKRQATRAEKKDSIFTKVIKTFTVRCSSCCCLCFRNSLLIRHFSVLLSPRISFTHTSRCEIFVTASSSIPIPNSDDNSQKFLHLRRNKITAKFLWMDESALEW